VIGGAGRSGAYPTLSTENCSATRPDRRQPGRTLGGGSNVQRGQLKPRTLTLRTSHFPDPPTATIQLKEHHSY
jgi:hypothetical protein